MGQPGARAGGGGSVRRADGRRAGLGRMDLDRARPRLASGLGLGGGGAGAVVAAVRAGWRRAAGSRPAPVAYRMTGWPGRAKPSTTQRHRPRRWPRRRRRARRGQGRCRGPPIRTSAWPGIRSRSGDGRWSAASRRGPPRRRRRRRPWPSVRPPGERRLAARSPRVGDRRPRRRPARPCHRAWSGPPRSRAWSRVAAVSPVTAPQQGGGAAPRPGAWRRRYRRPPTGPAAATGARSGSARNGGCVPRSEGPLGPRRRRWPRATASSTAAVARPPAGRGAAHGRGHGEARRSAGEALGARLDVAGPLGGLTVVVGAQGLEVGVVAQVMSLDDPRVARGSRLPGSSGTSAARPRAMRERTVPGGMSSTSAISA